MNTYLLESLEDGSHGMIPDEGINYFVGRNRITVHKDGKKVIDKVLDINPDGNICKYNLLCDDNKEPELKPVTDVEEFNVANMLPQAVPEGAILNKLPQLVGEAEEEYEDITIDDTFTESVDPLTVLVGGTVAIVGTLIAVKVTDYITKCRAIDWYAEHNNVTPKFIDLTKKNFRVKYDKKAHDSKLTNHKKLVNLDNNNVAEVYFYKGERAFAVIYGCKNVDIELKLNGYMVTKRITTKVVVFDPKFKKHIEYYAAKSMMKHKYTLGSIEDWITSTVSDYKKYKKDIVKESDEMHIENLRDDFDATLETCDNIIDGITNTVEESTSDEEGELITESTNDELVEENKLTDTVSNFAKVTKSELSKIKDVTAEKLSLMKNLKKEDNNLKKNDLKRKILKNQKDFRELTKKFSPKHKEKLNKIYNSVNMSNANNFDMQNLNNQINEFNQQMLRDNQTAMQAHQTEMDMHNQAMAVHNQNMMMNSMMF